MTAVIGWRFAYVIRTTYKWWVEVCANGKQEVATGCFHRWSGHELTPLHRPMSLSFSLPLSFSVSHLLESLFFSPFTSFSLPRVLAFPSSTRERDIYFSFSPDYFFYAPLLLFLSRVLVSKPSFVFLSVLFSLCPKLTLADPWHVMLDV